MRTHIFFIILPILITGCLATPKVTETPIKTLITKNKSQNNTVFFKSHEWWVNANNPELTFLINEILKTNSDLKISKLNIEKAIYTLNSTKNSNFSSVDLGADWNRNHVLTSSVKTDLDIKNIKNSDTIDLGSVGIQAEYIFDIWGKFDALEKQAQYSKLATELQSEWSTLTLSTLVANLYGKYIFLVKEENIFQKKLNIAEEILKYQNILYQTGLGNNENISIAKNNVLSLKQNIVEINTQKVILKNSFYTLVGDVNSETIDNTLAKIDSNTHKFDYFLDIPNYIDSDIAINRPDVKYYLALISSEKENLKSLKADFYPRFSITGKYLYQNINVQDLLKAHSTLWEMGPSLYLPLFNRNTLTQNYKIAGVNLNIFIENYNNNLIKAYQDINNSLSILKTSKSNNLLEESKYKNIKSNYLDSNTLYKIGSISKLELLNSENNLLDTELSYIENNFNLYTNQINLIGSIGGYYKNEVK
ncbi:MAG: TolC family protein [Cetobacterium sp.]|uniref:TolC family protein n=1 Tax=Cetobacterium sp. TaxID=2071632 RepID=UPI003F3E653D